LEQSLLSLVEYLPQTLLISDPNNPNLISQATKKQQLILTEVFREVAYFVLAFFDSKACFHNAKVYNFSRVGVL